MRAKISMGSGWSQFLLTGACLALVLGINVLRGILAADPEVKPAAKPAAQAETKPLRLLFLGDKGHHQPEPRFKQLQTALAPRDIVLNYTENMADLNAKLLNEYDGLIVYANTTEIKPDQEQALLDFVAGGKGFIPLHCASYCFLNSEKYIALVGGQFKKHGGEVFRVENDAPDHPLMKGYGGFESWDETYIHTKHNEKDRTILEYRVQGNQEPNQKREPWTWIRTDGKGRVFYTAWGHDERTWSNPGFQNLVERGIRWACNADLSAVPPYSDPAHFVVPEMTAVRTDVKPAEYDDVGPKIPNYVTSNTWGKMGKALSLMQRPLPPAESLKHYQTPVGFEMKLYASEENFLNKPIAMNWDERGRLWLCETLDYPNEHQQPGKGRDRIRICEDTDGDNMADKFTVFAEGLSIPTAILPIRGGVIVQNAQETLFLKDTDGDGKADVRKPLITGWAINDTHGGVSNFVYGFDNWIWAMQGYNDSQPVLTNGEKTPGFRQGFFRFKLDDSDPPNATAIEFIRSTDNNTWGIGFSEEGLLFGSTANRNPSVYMPIPNRYYEAVRGWTPGLLAPKIADTHLFVTTGSDKIRQVDHHAGYTAGAGHALYTARNYPPQWWNKTAFVCEPTGKLVGTFLLTPDGAGFKSKNVMNLVQSNDEWAAPIMAEVGPDGNVWILDWYNFVVQHNPTPAGFKTGKGNAYESDLRDKRHGRIYRLVYNGNETSPANGRREPPVSSPASTAKSEPIKSLHNATPQQLLAALSSDNLFWRRQAQRLIVERKLTELVPELARLGGVIESVDELGLNVTAIQAIATLNGLGFWKEIHAENIGPLIFAIQSKSPGVRRAALQILSVHEKTVNLINMSGVLIDVDPQVRLAAFLALADQQPSEEAGKVLAKLAADPATTRDRWLSEALTCAAAKHAVYFLQAASTSDEEKQFFAKIENTEYRPPTEPEIRITRIVSEHLARGKPDAAALRQILATLPAVHPDRAAAIIGGLSKGWPKGHAVELSDADEKLLTSLVETLTPEAKGQLIRLAAALGSKEFGKYSAQLIESWTAQIADATLSGKDRIAAAKELFTLVPADASAVTKVLEQITPQASPDLVAGLLDAVSGSTAENVGAELIARAAKLTPAGKDAALLVLLQRPTTTVTLLAAIEQGTLLTGDLKLDQQQALASHPDRIIRDRAKKLLAAGGGLPNPDREIVLKAYHKASESKGDFVRGKKLYADNCAKCHRHSGEGANIGPELTGMAVHPKHELLTQILDPSRSVESNFRQYTVETTEGQVFTGLLAAESRTAIELIDTEAKKRSIPRDEIETLTATTKSLMPEGFEKTLSVEQMTDLLEFLATRGKFLPLPLGKVVNAVSTRSIFFADPATDDTIRLSDWTSRKIAGIDFTLIDPQGDRAKNIILFHGANGKIPPTMPKSVTLPCGGPAKAIHLLSGISGWGHPLGKEKETVLTVRLHYADGKTEDHALLNGVHFSDYIRRIDVPGSTFALDAGGRQIRYLSVQPDRAEPITEIEFVKGPDISAPIIMAVTVESP